MLERMIDQDIKICFANLSSHANAEYSGLSRLDGHCSGFSNNQLLETRWATRLFRIFI